MYNNTTQSAASPVPVSPVRPTGFQQLIKTHPDLRQPIIEGILRRGEVANVIAAPKQGKSLLAGGLAWAVATRQPWLGFNTFSANRILIIDNELHRETLAYRLNSVAEAMKVPDGVRDAVDVVPLRGLAMPITEMAERLAVNAGEYDLVILDALYRTLPAGISENDNAAMMSVYNSLDVLADRWGAAIVVVHHSSKGNQSEKSITDVGAGAGAISRAADTHIAIRPHEMDGLCVMDVVARSFRAPVPLSIRFKWPLWSATDDKPAVQKPTRQKQNAREDAELMEKIFEKIPSDSTGIRQRRLFEQLGLGEGKARRLMGRLIDAKRIGIRYEQINGEKREAVFYYRIQECNSDSGSECNSGAN